MLNLLKNRQAMQATYLIEEEHIRICNVGYVFFILWFIKNINQRHQSIGMLQSMLVESIIIRLDK